MARPRSPLESPSPPAQPLSKRDLRRNRIVERLQSMVDEFSTNQHQHYRAQLQAVQVDMTLILRADPYSQDDGEGNGMLDDAGEDIKREVEAIAAQVPDDEAAQRDYHALAGSRYREFVRQVNDGVERRDAGLTALHNHYTAAVAELERVTQQKLHQAEEEHKALTSTIRQRLIATISKKRAQLLRDKEQLDIADSNALLLHPNQFGINNPGSPPNGLQNRKTRHTRHRVGSPAPGDLEPNGIKKRKFGAVEDDGNESPAPAFRPLPPPDALGGGRSPFKDARGKNTYAQYEAPAYSLERIFTDKELAMATDTAKLATYRYFHQPPAEKEQGSNGNGTAVASTDGEGMETAEGEDAPVATTEGANGTPPPGQPAAAEMERSTSHQVLTRGGARANPLAALQDLANLAANERAAPSGGTSGKDPFAPVIPSYHAVTRSEKSGAPAPSGVSHLDMDNDFAMMKQSGPRGAGAADADSEVMADADDEDTALHMRRQLLDQALSQSTTTQPYRLPLLETGPAVIGKGVERIPGTGFAPVMSMEQRSLIQKVAQTSGAPSAMAAALRAGGEPMSRTTSAGGVSEAGLEAPPPKRGRGRQMV
ncbi:uncharacterized protein LTR77_000585 [Saxophila tyrrhenica]|uniref:Uncharacterized protein n=1 Tax=Saxophila tyrrhenica TaxID=1690608 RepID=A0AAV9PNZ4_9PEZI|nr:hypothetical protein LTR77_000585 [Saxophila tyrrhenica]